MPVSLTNPTDHNPKILQRLTNAGSYLFVGAHPDDIEFYCGALVRELTGQGKRVQYVILTRGGKGRQGEAKHRLEMLRTRHQQQAATLLGVESVDFLDFPDGSLSAYENAAADQLREVVRKADPETFVCWDPKHIYNPHPDHVAAARICDAALGSENVVYYGTQRPNVWFGFGDNMAKAKLASILAHKTEAPWFYQPILWYVLFRKLRMEGRKVGARYAETFRFKEV